MSGRKANEAGESHLNIVHEILCKDGNFIPASLRRSGPGALAELVDLSRNNMFGSCRVMARHVPICLNQFDDPYTADFVAFDAAWPDPVALICFSQTSSGSIYWKVPAWMEIVREHFPPQCRAALVLAGNAYHRRLPAYAERCIGRSGGKLCRVFRDIDDFRNWARDGAPFPAREQAVLPL